MDQPEQSEPKVIFLPRGKAQYSQDSPPRVSICDLPRAAALHRVSSLSPLPGLVSKTMCRHRVKPSALSSIEP
ncbi:hypothetical protein DPEC_G00380600 [Dallia pectoralis]|nr:hypothetical protein DPEC_G00380600 [Dallia pectoralis]